MNLLQVAETFATEDMALAYWIMTRWPNEAYSCLRRRGASWNFA